MAPGRPKGLSAKFPNVKTLRKKVKAIQKRKEGVLKRGKKGKV